MHDLLIELVAGLAVGASMGLLGAGGAIFTVPVFGALLGHAPKDAFLEALAVTGAIAAVSAVLAAGRVDRRRALLFAGAGIVGTQAAAPVAVRMDARVQVVLFAMVAGFAAWRMWSSASGKSPPTASVEAAPRGGTAGTLLLGFAIGMLTSVLGVGGGFLLIPALVLREGLAMPVAVGTSLAVIAVNSTAGLLGQWWSGGFAASGFDLGAVGTTAGFGLLGSWAGARLAGRLPQATVRRAFAVLLALVAAWMASRTIFGG